jgi:hypothetical protein
MVLSVRNNPPRLQFQQEGAGSEANPQYKSWIGQAKENSDDIALMGGNVGIGTDDPGAKLEVSGGIKLANTGSPQTLIFSRTNETGTPDGDGFRIKYDRDYFGTNYDALIIEKTDGNLIAPDGGVVFTNTGNNGVEQAALVIRGNGRVGIGTDPQTTLHVNGSVRGNQTGGSLRVNTRKGYVDIGPRNNNWSHFETDRSKFYFNKEIRVGSGQIGSYNEDLQLRTSGTTRITVRNSDGRVTVGGQLRVTVNGRNRILGGNPARYVETVRLHADNGADTQEIDLGSTRRVYAFVSIIGMDPKANFGRRDAFAVDIFKIDGSVTERWRFGGDHFGPDGDDRNYKRPSFRGSARKIMFRARSFHDASVFALGIVFYD